MNKIYRLLRFDLPLHFVLTFTNWLPDTVTSLRLRGFLARPFFKKCGKHVGIGRHVTFYNPSNISIGNWVYIAYGCWFSASKEIVIEDEVLLGPYNIIATSNHTRLNGSFRFGVPDSDSIILKKGSWLGASCSVLKGASIGKGSVIAANSVVVGEVPDNCMFAGSTSIIKKYYAE
jgi:acetyltransferase-like isoleucine patch superfamily enzyme